MDTLQLSAADRLLVVAPHPDDETLGAGGLLQRAAACGAAVRVCYATSGENNPWAQRAFERRLVIGAPARARFGARRQDEARAALARLDLDPGCAVYLGLPDQGLRRLLLAPDAALTAPLLAQFDRFRPTVIALPSPLELHPDHSALAVATHLALADAAPGTPAPLLLAYLVHNPSLRRTAAAAYALLLTAEERDRKHAAVLSHRSQLVWRSRWLVAFAGPEERFYEASPGPGTPSHPIRAARRTDAGLDLELASRPRPRAFGRQRLRLVGQRQGRPVRLSVDLPLSGRGRAIVDLATGASAGACRCAGPPWRRRIALRTDALDGAAPVWAHVERRVGFFDEGGWVRLAGARSTSPRAEG
jgi:LmbE family N-acetylglucosaminyl deacetylase